MRLSLVVRQQNTLRVVLLSIFFIGLCVSPAHTEIATLPKPENTITKEVMLEFFLTVFTNMRWLPYTLRSIEYGNIQALVWVIYSVWWAVLVSVLVVIGVSYSLIQIYLNREKVKQLEVTDRIKEQFYTNITHEFRTPLALILASVEQLKQGLGNSSDWQRLEIINQNATHLLGLVNQLMELSKAETNVLKVRESQGDLVDFLTRLVQLFELQAAEKGIQLILRTEKTNAQYWFDAAKLDRIVHNILANALKFTPVGGRIIVNLTIDNTSELIDSSQTDSGQSSRIRLEISDNGIGIPPEKLPYIFSRFCQVKDDGTEQQNGIGIGIGLALVKELVEAQQGTIQVVSRVSIGTTFVITLPYRRTVDVIQPVLSLHKPEIIKEQNAQQQYSNESPVLLIVEDNQVFGDFITDNLSRLYRIHRAGDGAEGWEKVLQVMPDLVISDVLMPVMDGYELCQKIKKDDRTSHIPLILLTAKTSIDNKLEALALGADDYIVKPFYVQELQLRIQNLLGQRQQLRKWALTDLTNPTTESITDETDPLIERLCQIIEQHLDDATFGVEELILSSGMSRMNLHRKLKTLVDIPAGEFIRNYRLKRAAQLLHQGRSVSETAYLVGFEDPSYFTRSFRKLYQMTPSDYSRRK